MSSNRTAAQAALNNTNTLQIKAGMEKPSARDTLSGLSDMMAPIGGDRVIPRNAKAQGRKKKLSKDELQEQALLEDQEVAAEHNATTEANQDMLVAANSDKDEKAAVAIPGSSAASTETTLNSTATTAGSATINPLSSIMSAFAGMSTPMQVGVVAAGAIATGAVVNAVSSDSSSSSTPSNNSDGGSTSGGSTSGGTSGGASNSQFIATSTTLVGVLTAGPVKPNHDLRVAVYDDHGQSLPLFELDGTAVAASSGLYSIALNNDGSFSVNVGTYVGPIVVRVYSSGDAPDYYDEATGQSVDMGLDLHAASVIEKVGGQVNFVIHVTPLAEMVLQVLKATQGVDSLSQLQLNAADVVKYNKAIAEVFGLGLVDITKILPAAMNASLAASALSDTDGFYTAMLNGQTFIPSEVGELYGMVLAVLSQMDELNGGDAALTIAQLTGAMNVTTDAQNVLIQLTDRTRLAEAKIQALASDLITLAYAPTVQDYALAGVAGVTNENILAVNRAISSLTASDVTAANGSVAQAIGDATVAAIDSYQSTVTQLNAWIKADYASGNALTPNQLAELGIVVLSGSSVATQTTQNLSAAQATELNTLLAVNHASTIEEVVAIWNALQRVDAWINDDSNPNRAPTTQDYALLGTDTVSSNALVAVNHAVAELTPVSGSLTTGNDGSADIAIVNAVNASLLAYNSAITALDSYAFAASGAATPAAADYAALGFGDLTAEQVAFLNAALLNVGGLQASTAQTFIEAALHVYAWTQDSSLPSTAPTLAQYQALGLGDVSAATLAAINAAVADASGSSLFASVATQSQTALNDYAAAVAAIEAYANGNSTTAPTADQYAAAGIAGVSADNLAILNAALLERGSINGDQIDSFVASALVVLGWVADNSDLRDAPTVTDWANLGYSSINASNLSLVNAAVGGTDSTTWTAIDGSLTTVIDAFSTALTSLSNYAAGSGTSASGAPQLSVYESLGLTGVTADNLASVNDAFSAFTSVRASQVGDNTAAILKLLAWVADDSNAALAPTVADYQLAGITGVTAGNLAAVNTAVADATVGSARSLFVALSTDVGSAITDYNTAMNACAAYAAGFSSTAPTGATYEALGLTTVAADDVAALNEALRQLGGITAADLPGVIEALQALQAWADGGTTAPTAEDYATLGYTDVTAANLSRYNTIVGGLNDQSSSNITGDFLAKLNHYLAAADTALATLQAYALGGSTAPTAQDYANAGISGVDSGNLSSINTALQNVGWAPFTSADSILALSAIADYVANPSGTAPTLVDYADAGISGVTAYNLAALNAALADLGAINLGAGGLAIDSAAQAISLARIANYAHDSSYPAPTALDYSNATHTTVPSGNATAINALVAAGAQADFDSADEILAACEKIADLVTPFQTQQAASNTTISAGAISALLGYTVDSSLPNLISPFIRAVSANQVSSVADIKALLNAYFHLADWNAGTSTTAPTLHDYELLGYTDLTPALVAEYNAQLSQISGSFQPSSLVNTSSQTVVDAMAQLNDWLTASPTAAGTFASGNAYATDLNAVGTALGLGGWSGLSGQTDLLAQLRANFNGEEMSYADVLRAQSQLDAQKAFNDWAQNFNYDPAANGGSAVPTAKQFTTYGYVGVTADNRLAVAEAIHDAQADAIANNTTTFTLMTLSQQQAIITPVVQAIDNAWNHISTWLADPTTTAPTGADIAALGFAVADKYLDQSTTTQLSVVSIDDPLNPNIYTTVVIPLQDLIELLGNSTLNGQSTKADFKDVMDALYRVGYQSGTPESYAEDLATFGIGDSAVAAQMAIAETGGRLFGYISGTSYRPGAYFDTPSNYQNRPYYDRDTSNDVLEPLATFLTAWEAQAVTRAQAAVTAFSAWANGLASNSSLTAPNDDDYTVLGLTPASAGVFSSLNTIVGAHDFTGLSSAQVLAQLQNIYKAVNTILDYDDEIPGMGQSNRGQTAPTVEQYTLIGITGVDASNVAFVNNKLGDAFATNFSSSTDLKADLQTMIDTELPAHATAVTAAMTAINDWVSGASTTAPTTQNYQAALTGFDSGFTAVLNQVIATAAANTYTAAGLQTLFDQMQSAWDNVRTGTGTLADFETLGATTVTQANLSLVNSYIESHQISTNSGTFWGHWTAMYGNLAYGTAEALKVIDGGTYTPSFGSATTYTGLTTDLADAQQTIYDYALNNHTARVWGLSSLPSTGLPTQADYELLGLVGGTVNRSNIGDGLLTPDSQSVVVTDSVSRFNAWLISAAQPFDVTTVDGLKAEIVKFEAVSKLLENKKNGLTTATVQDYLDAGFDGVTAENLSVLNRTLVNTKDGNSSAQITAIDSFQGRHIFDILAVARDSFDGWLQEVNDFAGSVQGSSLYYTLQGLQITGFPTGQGPSAVAPIENLIAASTDTFHSMDDVQNVVDYYNAAQKVLDYVGDSTKPAPTQADYLDLGISGLPDGVAGVLTPAVTADSDIAALDKTATADLIALKSSIQSLLDGALVQNYLQSLATFQVYADDQTAAAPVAADYAALGVTVPAGFIDAVNDKVAHVFGRSIQSADDVESLVTDTVVDLGASGYLLDAVNNTSYADYGTYQTTGLYIWDRDGDKQITAADQVSMSDLMTELFGSGQSSSKFTLNGQSLKLASAAELDFGFSATYSSLTADNLPDSWNDANEFHAWNSTYQYDSVTLAANATATATVTTGQSISGSTDLAWIAVKVV